MRGSDRSGTTRSSLNRTNRHGWGMETRRHAETKAATGRLMQTSQFPQHLPNMATGDREPQSTCCLGNRKIRTCRWPGMAALGTALGTGASGGGGRRGRDSSREREPVGARGSRWRCQVLAVSCAQGNVRGHLWTRHGGQGGLQTTSEATAHAHVKGEEERAEA